jgi:multidrug resistance efflux pump
VTDQFQGHRVQRTDPDQPEAAAGAPNPATPVGRSAPAALAAVPPRLAAIAGSASGRSQFHREVLRAICEAVDAPFGLIHVRGGADVLDDSWHRGGGDPSVWRGPATVLLDETISTGRARARIYAAGDGRHRLVLLAHPVPDAAGATCGAIVVVIPGVADELIAATTSELGRTLSIAAFFSSNLGRGAGGSAGGAGGGGGNGTAGRFEMDALTAAGGARDRVHLAFLLANGLRTRTGTEMVAVGAVEGTRVRMLAISGFDEVKARSPGARRILSAMEECLDAGHRIVAQSGDRWDDEVADTRHRLHLAWHRSSGGAAVLSVPLRDGDDPDADIVGIVSVRARPGAPLGGPDIESIERTLAPYGLLVRTIERADRGVVRHAADAAGSWCRALAGPRTLARRLLVTAAIVLGLGWLAFGRLELRIAADASLVPASSRHVAAAMDGRLEAVLARDGQRVEAGQVLARLRTGELELELARLGAAIEVQRLEARRALVDGDLAGSHLAESEQRALEGEAAMVAERLARAEIRAPIAGTVVSSRLERELGRMITRGQLLFTIAGDDGWAVEVSIPERDIGEVGPGMRGRFAPRARPDAVHAVTLDRIAAAAAPAGGVNVFVAEARLDASSDWMRPGMEGVVRLDAGERPVWWVLGRRSISWVRRTFWL